MKTLNPSQTPSSTANAIPPKSSSDHLSRSSPENPTIGAESGTDRHPTVEMGRMWSRCRSCGSDELFTELNWGKRTRTPSPCPSLPSPSLERVFQSELKLAHVDSGRADGTEGAATGLNVRVRSIPYRMVEYVE